MNTLNECKKATSISTFDLYTKFPHKNFWLYLIVENKCITVNSYGAPWVKISNIINVP